MSIWDLVMGRPHMVNGRRYDSHGRLVAPSLADALPPPDEPPLVRMDEFAPMPIVPTGPSRPMPDAPLAPIERGRADGARQDALRRWSQEQRQRDLDPDAYANPQLPPASFPSMPTPGSTSYNPYPEDGTQPSLGGEGEAPAMPLPSRQGGYGPAWAMPGVVPAMSPAAPRPAPAATTAPAAPAVAPTPSLGNEAARGGAGGDALPGTAQPRELSGWSWEGRETGPQWQSFLHGLGDFAAGWGRATAGGMRGGAALAQGGAAMNKARETAHDRAYRNLLLQSQLARINEDSAYRRATLGLATRKADREEERERRAAAGVAAVVGGDAPASAGSFNVGNIRAPGGGFRTFGSPEEAVAATVRNAQAYPGRFNGSQPMTLASIGARWAPKGDGANDPDQWARNVASIGGLPIDQPLDLSDPATAARFAKGVHGAEFGQAALYGDEVYQRGVSGQRAPGNQVAQAGRDERGADAGSEWDEMARRALAAGNTDLAKSYVERAAAAREKARTERGKPRQLGQPTIDKLGEAGSAAIDIDRVRNTFKDDYGGYGLSAFGDVANFLRRNITSDDSGQAQFWQDYQNIKNVIRNKLFGAALTATEKAEFDKAQINPGMKPEEIRANLDRQHAAAMRAASKIANAWLKQGHDREAIEAALGISLDQLPDPVTPLGTTRSSGKTGAPPPGTTLRFDAQGNPVQ